MVHLLTKEDGPAELPGVTSLTVGASWDTSTGGAGGLAGFARKLKGSDLDLLAISCQGNADPVSYAGLDSQDPEPGVHHTGDNKTGKGDGDDETVVIDFTKVPGEITSVLLAVAAFKRGSSFAKAKNIKVRVYDSTGGSPEEVAVIRPSLLGNANFIGVARATRVNGDHWTLEVVNKPGNISQGNTGSLLRAAIGM